jgi:hypothetical protein
LAMPGEEWGESFSHHIRTSAEASVFIASGIGCAGGRGWRTDRGVAARENALFRAARLGANV